MNIPRDIKPITYPKSRTADLLKQIDETCEPIIITKNSKPKAALQDSESIQNPYFTLFRRGAVLFLNWKKSKSCLINIKYGITRNMENKSP